jgi:hypothetical protein
MSRVGGFFGKCHVILAESMDGRMPIQFCGIMPKAELTSSGHKVSAKDAAVVVQFIHRQLADWPDYSIKV